MRVLTNTPFLALIVALLASMSACEASSADTSADSTENTTTTDTEDTTQEEPKPFHGTWKIATKLVKDCGVPCPKGGELPATLDAEISVFGIGGVSLKLKGEGVSLSANGSMTSPTKLSAGFQSYLDEAGVVRGSANNKWNLGTTITLILDEGGKTAKGTMKRGLQPYDGSGKNLDFGREYDITATLQ